MLKFKETTNTVQVTELYLDSQPKYHVAFISYTDDFRLALEYDHHLTITLSKIS